jgi:hypothetical protein
MHRDTFERIVSATTKGIYESNYLKANSPDGQWGLWIKHNLLRPSSGPGIGEFWLVLSRPDGPPIVVKREVDLENIQTDPENISIATSGISLTPAMASGNIADIQWNLHLSGADTPLMHFPWDWMYTAGFPKKKALTPAPHLRFDGHIQIGEQRIDVNGWEGLRGHNWGREHAWTYAYGNCQLWDDGGRRTVDGFSAKIRLPGGLKSPWLSTTVARSPDCNLNQPGDWFGGVHLDPTSWTLTKSPHRLQMTTTAERMVGLRYAHPDGSESYCYNTKFAEVNWTVGDATFHSDKGEFESLFPTPVAEIPLHPTPDWDRTQGDYRS